MNSLDKINTLLLCDIVEHLGISTEHDTAFLRAAIYGGHNWAIEEKYGDRDGHSDERRNPVVEKVHDILRMWSVLEDSYEDFDEDQKAELLKLDPVFGKDVKWPGFDGNNESEYMSVAGFMIKHMDWYPQFKGREHLNSHMPTLGSFERMWPVFNEIWEPMEARSLSPQQMADVLSARRHPDFR